MTATNYGFKANITVGNGFAVFSGNGDIVSSANVNLNGAKIQADPITGAVAIIPAPTLAVSNPTAIIISPSGLITTSNTTNGQLSSSAYTAATAVTNTVVSNLQVTGSVVGNLTGITNLTTTGTANVGNLVASSITWANGSPITTGIKYSTGSNPPATGNNPGDQWYNTLNDTVYEWTFNGASYYWVDITSPSYGYTITGVGAPVTSTAPVVTTTANIGTLTVVNGIYWANGAAWSSGSTSSTFTGNGTNFSNISVSNISVGSSIPLISTEAYDLDDITNAADGFTNTFALTYNGTYVTVASPWNLDVSVNSVKQPAFKYNNDLVWFSYTLPANRGYCLDLSGNLRFADALPQGSRVTVTTKVGTNSQPIKRYPFNPLDIMLGI